MPTKRLKLVEDGRTHNALKHGCRTDAPVVGDEDASLWHEHLQGFIDSLRPTNAFEKQLVYRIALSAWKLLRVDRYEAACCNANYDRAGHDANRTLEASVLNPFAPPPLNADQLRALALIPGRQFEKIERYRQAEERSLARCIKTIKALRELTADASKSAQTTSARTPRRRLVSEQGRRPRPASRMNGGERQAAPARRPLWTPLTN